MRIYHNIPALNAYNNLSKTNSALSNSISKLSSGLRINSAADDAAGLAISEKMRAQISGLDMAVRNAQDGMSMVQTAEGALSETHSILQRMRELAVQAANDTLTQQDRSYIQLEINELREEVTRIANTTQFNKKKLLDGSAAALWSSDSTETNVYVRGAVENEGNYKIVVKATAGQGEVQKSGIFKIANENVLSNLSVDNKLATDVSIDNLPAGSYSVYSEAISGGSGPYVSGAVLQGFGLKSGATTNKFGFHVNEAGIKGKFSGSAQILLEVTNVDTVSKTVTFKAVAQTLNSEGLAETYVSDSIQVREGQAGTKWTAFGLTGGLFSLSADAISAAGYTVGDKMTVSLKTQQTAAVAGANNATLITVSGAQNAYWDDAWKATGYKTSTNNGLPTMTFALGTAVNGKDVHFRTFYLNTVNGTVYESEIMLGFSSAYAAHVSSTPSVVTSFNATYVGEVGATDTYLRDIDKFYDSNGTFLLNEPQTITITQGDGTNTKMTLYSTDTMLDVQTKLNDAIANGLGQAKYAIDDTSRFVTYVTENEKSENTSQSVAGTFVVRSIISGSDGEISFAGDEELIKALAFNVVTESKENQFNVSVMDAHTGATIASNVNITGNLLIGVVDDNVDVAIDPMADIEVKWDDANKRYTFKDSAEEYSSIVHLVNNTTTFQVGANAGEVMTIDMGNMGSEALGLNKIVVTDQNSASASLSVIDSAITRVSEQRAKLGAFQNRLEHTVNNLSTAAENLTSAESRIRDLDMSKEMVEFTKLNILSQAGTSMLAQANQLPQAVLQLLQS